MNNRGVIRNQRVSVQKVEMSRNFRKSMTKAEKVFWDMVRNRRMFGLKFRRQQVIDGFIIDFYCDSLGLSVEIDGGVHNEVKHERYDKERDEVLALRGLKIIRFSNDDILGKKDFVKESIRNLMGD